MSDQYSNQPNTENDEHVHRPPDRNNVTADEGGLHAPPDLHGWGKAWWWFHFLILVNLARLRFVAILAVIGIVIMRWDTLAAYYDRWTRPANTPATAADSDYEYYCPMHPSIVRDNNKEPCPICFMPLAKRKKGSTSAEPLPAGVVNRVQLSPYRVALAGVQTWLVDFVPLTKDIKTVGFIEFNERGQKTVAARFPGRIDKLFANETGQMVEAGENLALIYSPDVLVTVRNMLDANRHGNADLVESSRVRLQLLGIDDQQLDEILASGKADSDIRVRAPLSGHVITKYVQEGQYVQEGAPLFDLAELSSVWIEGQIYEDDLAFLPAGYANGPKDPGALGLAVTATTRSLPGEQFDGKLSFIYPHVDQDSRTATVRFELPNPGHKLRPGATAEVTLKIRPQDVQLLASAAIDPEQKRMLAAGKVLAVPESSVIDTGSQKIVYRQRSPGVFEGVDVKLGPPMVDPQGAVFYPVLSGLQAGEHVVTSGSFLVDAETRLNPAAGSIYFGNSGSTQSSASSDVNIRPSTPPEPAATPAAPEVSEAEIQANLAKLSMESRAEIEKQRFCPISGNRLGAMGPPIQLTIDNETVWLCCEGCKEDALKDPKATLTKVNESKQGK
jgi:Cu(I)/Ag(I) efflux system membrane fusion protein